MKVSAFSKVEMSPLEFGKAVGKGVDNITLICYNPSNHNG